MPLDLSKRVLVKPCNVFFYYSAEGTYNTCKVLIVNKSTRILRFKVLSTARSKYLLSTCKGVLKSGEHYICSTISRNLSHNVAVQDSDSCSTWPSRYHDVGLSASNLRTASLSRAFESLTESEKRPITPQTHLSLDRTKCSNLPDVFSTVKAQKNKSNSGTLTIYRGVGGNHSESRRTSIIFSPNMLYNSLFVLSLFVCLLGILLPFFPYDCKLWLLSKVLHERQKIDYITTTASSLTFLREAQKVYGYSHPDKQNSRTTHSSANECPTVDNPSKDEFNRQTRLAFFAFKSAFRSICRAITALDPLVAVANVSWFCLGLLLMYRWTTRR
ncbi:hypothetical protein KSF78_0001126 [Schistosoma japonicum]|nr:hypothetical protein KSF78_0001126 [Schistosoma japonicum]